MKKLIIATHNRDKFKEMIEALKGLSWELVPAYECLGIPEVVENGATLEENSLKKAKIISEFMRLPALADDTGFFVDALNGQPGIYAARFAGEKCSYADNVKKVLLLLKNIPIPERTAFFRTIITIYYPDKPYQQVMGEVKGTVTEQAHEGGFGYDPIFMPDGFSNVFSEISLKEKNKISHRGLAMQKARMLLENLALF